MLYSSIKYAISIFLSLIFDVVINLYATYACHLESLCQKLLICRWTGWTRICFLFLLFSRIRVKAILANLVSFVSIFIFIFEAWIYVSSLKFIILAILFSLYGLVVFVSKRSFICFFFIVTLHIFITFSWYSHSSLSNNSNYSNTP